jgi:thioredoxin-related protein
MKNIFLSLCLLYFTGNIFSQELKDFHLYIPTENAEVKIAAAVKQAKKEAKHVFIQVGGNWCIWCARFHDFITKDSAINSLVKASYVVYHLNYSDENKNLKLLAKYGYPQRFGYPVFLILDGNGKLLHIQNSGYLENGKKSYDRESVIGFLNDWSPVALDPKKYIE